MFNLFSVLLAVYYRATLSIKIDSSIWSSRLAAQMIHIYMILLHRPLISSDSVDSVLLCTS